MIAVPYPFHELMESTARTRTTRSDCRTSSSRVNISADAAPAGAGISASIEATSKPHTL